MGFADSFGWLFGVLAGGAILWGFTHRDGRIVLGALVALLAAFAMGYGVGHDSARHDAELHRIGLDVSKCYATAAGIEEALATNARCREAVSDWMKAAPKDRYTWTFMAGFLLLIGAAAACLHAAVSLMNERIDAVVAREKGGSSDLPLAVDQPGGMHGDRAADQPAGDRQE